MKKIILRAAGATLAAIALVNGQPLRAQSSSDTARIEKLERAVELLAKQNAELKAEIKSMKSKPTASASASAVAVEGKTKTQVISDGKTYVEKLVPDLQGEKNGNCFRRSPNWSFSVTCDCDTNTAAGGFPVMIRTLNHRATPMIGMRRNGNVTVCAWDCVAQYLITGSLDFDWRPARALARRMSQWAVMPATATARLTRATMALPWDRLISVIRVSLALP